MRLYGQFSSIHGATITVSIITGGSTVPSLTIGTEEAGVWFADDPVETETQVNDTFDHLLLTQARIRLLCRSFMPDLYARSCTDVAVVIKRGGQAVFTGFVEPMSLSQSYNDVVDEVELTCIDRLCALSHLSYVPAGKSWEQMTAEARQRQWYSIMAEMLRSVAPDPAGQLRIWYDGSKAVSSSQGSRYTIFGQLSISELLFLSESEDKAWKQDEVLEEMLRYLNLHMAQAGDDFYIFSWETLRSGRSVTWADIATLEQKVMEVKKEALSMQNVMADDATLTLSEVYSQLQVTDEVTDMEELVSSPLDSEVLTSNFSRWQLYMTEYASDYGSGHYWAMRDLLQTGKTDYSGASQTEWHIQVMRHPQWRFPVGGDTGSNIEDYCQAASAGQQNVPQYLADAMGACVMRVGKVKKRISPSDNSPEDKPDMKPWLVISVNGNEKDTEADAMPTAEMIRAATPVAMYEGAQTGGVFSPADEETTNYIVISGSMVLCSVMHDTAPYETMKKNIGSETGDGSDSNYYYYMDGPLMPSATSGTGRLYTRAWWAAWTPRDEPELEPPYRRGWYPHTGGDQEYYKFRYSAVGDSGDHVSKVGCVACMLIVGDKCAVETGHTGTADDITWQPYKEMAQCESEDEYWQQSFTIGFDPKIGDCLIGHEHQLQNTVTDAMNINADGIAIPVRMSDKVSGQVRFIVLGVCNVMWDDVTRRHPTFFRHTKWTTTTVPLMAHVSSVIIKDIGIKIYSDNGLYDQGAESNDIIYLSDTAGGFANKKDDVSFRLTSALTTAECQKLGVKNRISMSTPLSSASGLGVAAVYNRWKDELVKPEHDYIDSYYTEYSQPKVELQQKLYDDGGEVGMLNLYTSQSLGRTFHVVGVSRNLYGGWAQVDMKEV